MPESTEEKLPRARERLVTRNGWIGCALVALLLTAGKRHLGEGAIEFAERFIGSLAVVVVVWIIFRLITQKRPTA